MLAISNLPSSYEPVARLGSEAQNPLNANERTAAVRFRGDCRSIRHPSNSACWVPLRCDSGGELLPLGGPRQRALLALLCLNRGRVVSVDRIVDELWGDSAPASARHMVEVYVSKLRGLLGPHALTTRSPGYVLQLEPELSTSTASKA